MLRQGLEEVEGRGGSVGHGDELAVPVGVWRPHPSHLPVQGRLDVSTFPPDQRWNVSKKAEEESSISATLLEQRMERTSSKRLSTYLSSFPDKFCRGSVNMGFSVLYIHARIGALSPLTNTSCVRSALEITGTCLHRQDFKFTVLSNSIRVISVTQMKKQSN